MTRALVPLAALAVFAATLALLAGQMRAGRDPALGRPVAAAPPRHILIRRIERRVIMTRVIRDAPAAPARTAAAPPAIRVTAAPPPARVVVPAPAPAPAPAPLVSKTS
jgi:hypothetical protein